MLTRFRQIILFHTPPGTSHKMAKHTQTIRRQFAHCIWPFWVRNNYLQKLLQWLFLLHYNSFINRIEILLQFRKLHVRRITPKFQISTWILSTKWMKGITIGAAVHTWKQNFYWIKTKETPLPSVSFLWY